MLRIYQRLREIQSSKVPLARALVERSGQMRPGWYRIRGNVIYAIGVDKPAALETTLQFLTGRKAPSARTLVLRTLELLTPPVVIRVPSKAGETSGTASQLMISKAGDIKVFDTTKRIVTTYYSKPEKLTGIFESRATLTTALPIVALRPTTDSTGTIEPLVDGTPFWKVSLPGQIAAYKRLLTAYSAHMETAVHTYWSHEVAQAAVEKVLSMPLPRKLYESLVYNMDSVRRCLTESPMIASHGDLSISNVLVSSEGVVLIDLEDASQKHFFYDLMYLQYSLARLGPSPLIDIINAGRFDSDFRALFRSAKCEYPDIMVPHWLAFLVVRLKKTLSAGMLMSADNVRMVCAPLFNIGVEW